MSVLVFCCFEHFSCPSDFVAFGGFMAGRGPAPRPVRARETDTKRRDAELTRVVPDGVLRGRDLPDHDWHPRTVRWWLTWRRSAQARTFCETDWDFLEDTAYLYDSLAKGDSSLAAEVRIRVAKFGATPEDRMRLKLAVDEVSDSVPEPARVDSDRKARLMAVVSE